MARSGDQVVSILDGIHKQIAKIDMAGRSRGITRALTVVYRAAGRVAPRMYTKGQVVSVLHGVYKKIVKIDQAGRSEDITRALTVVSRAAARVSRTR